MKIFQHSTQLPVTSLELGDEDADADTARAGEAVHGEVGVEGGVLHPVLLQLQADTEVDDELVESDGCNRKKLPGESCGSYRPVNRVHTSSLLSSSPTARPSNTAWVDRAKTGGE